MHGRTGEAAVAGVTELCQELLGPGQPAGARRRHRQPGVVDPDGVVLQAPNLGWTDLPLAAKLAAELGLPVHVANDANTAALGEHTYGGAGGSGLMVVAIGKGVGAGAAARRRLLGGHHYAAGEIGHVIVDERGQVVRLRPHAAASRPSCPRPPSGRAIKGLDDRKADEALAAAGRRLGTALAPIVSALDLREVVLSGPADLLGGALRDAAIATIRERTMPVVGNDVDLRMTVLGEDVVLSGAAVLVLSGQLGVS